MGDELAAIKFESDDKKYYQGKINSRPTNVVVVDEGTDKLYTLATGSDEYRTAIEQGRGRFGKISKVFTFDEITAAIVSGEKLIFNWKGKKIALKVSYHEGIKF